MTERVVVFLADDRVWRWRYEQDGGGDPTVLECATAFESSSEAEESARTAYPDVSVEVPGRVRRTAVRRWPLLLLTVVMTTALGYVVLQRRRRRARTTEGREHA